MKGFNLKVVILIVLLLGVNIVLLVSNFKTKQRQEILAQERVELVAERDSLITSLNSVQDQLTQELGLNSELNRLIEEKTSEIDSIKVVYRSKLFNAEASNASLKNMLAEAKQNIDSLQTEYTMQIAALSTQLEVAELENTELREEVKVQRDQIATLQRDLDIAELFKLDEVMISAVTKTGKRRRNTTIAQKTEELNICLDIPRNQLIPAGKHELLIRILNPDGATLAIQSNGSGTFTLAEQQKNSLFSKKILVDYSPGKPIEICTSWLQSFPFKAGKYVAEVYHKGYLVKAGEISLRNKSLF